MSLCCSRQPIGTMGCKTGYFMVLSILYYGNMLLLTNQTAWKFCDYLCNNISLPISIPWVLRPYLMESSWTIKICFPTEYWLNHSRKWNKIVCRVTLAMMDADTAIDKTSRSKIQQSSRNQQITGSSGPWWVHWTQWATGAWLTASSLCSTNRTLVLHEVLEMVLRPDMVRKQCLSTHIGSVC